MCTQLDILFDHCTGYPKKYNTIKNVTIKYQILRMLITTQHGYRHIYSLATSGDWHGLVTCGCRSRGRGSRSCSRRVTAQARALGLGLAASIHQQILTTPVQSSNGKFISLLLRTFCVCAACSQSSAYPSNPYPHQ